MGQNEIKSYVLVTTAISPYGIVDLLHRYILFSNITIGIIIETGSKTHWINFIPMLLRLGAISVSHAGRKRRHCAESLPVLEQVLTGEFRLKALDDGDWVSLRPLVLSIHGVIIDTAAGFIGGEPANGRR